MDENKKKCKVCKKQKDKFANKDTCTECFNKPKPKYYYDVKVEAMLPATLTYRILAETPEEAVEMIRGRQPNTVQHRLIGRKDLKIIVYDAGCSVIKFMKNLFGG